MDEQFTTSSRLEASAPRTLRPALPGVRRELRSALAGTVSWYQQAPPGTLSALPLLLVHSINAAASAYEMKPLYEHYARTRAVYALDLPGFGLSSRERRFYDPRLMTDALLALIAQIRQETGAVALDALALSLSAEYLVRAAIEAPEALRSLGGHPVWVADAAWCHSLLPAPHLGQPSDRCGPARL